MQSLRAVRIEAVRSTSGGTRWPYSSMMTRALRLCGPIAALLGILAARPARAATYYLAPAGSDAGAGTRSSPWKTFDFALRKLSPGDSLLLMDGTYAFAGAGSSRVPIDCR